MNAIEKLQNLAEALADELLELEDEELLEELRDAGIDPHAVAEDVRRIFERVVQEVQKDVGES